MNVAISLGLVAAGIALARFGAVRLNQPAVDEDVVWERRHPVLARLLAGPSPSARKPATIARTGAVGCLLGGVFLVVVGVGLAFS